VQIAEVLPPETIMKVLPVFCTAFCGEVLKRLATEISKTAGSRHKRESRPNPGGHCSTTSSYQ
jgi:hypothetical protein